ncbi:YjfB family protein [Paenibacillus sp. P96]|uniref:YjfB family protein n=1 Tax=Paenibacillus zeirhizosphaerae TaxID=2987519 RepID=A0ABT9FLV1_9BACL|nr:YjfB family protein [Paenibacillus sp. P96]MDP4095704.1 YjfB family protein [Paenibacillus sp. P96]
MDIGAMSMALSQSSLKLNAGMKVISISKEMTETQGQAMIQMMEKSVQPNLGGNLDIRV